MSKNHMAEVAKIFGVKLGESFKITSDTQGDYPGDYQNYYRFTEDNCLEISNDGVEMKSWQIFSSMIEEALMVVFAISVLMIAIACMIRR